MGGTTFLIIGALTLLGVAINFMRLWTFLSGAGGNRARVGRIADSDAHLSFDERIAERMRDLEKENRATAPPSGAIQPRGFGRRES